MAIKEQMETVLTAVPGTGAEWTAKPLRPVARWIETIGPDGAGRLEMVWSVPDPRASDAL